jgi:hypothetical protein
LAGEGAVGSVVVVVVLTFLQLSVNRRVSSITWPSRSRQNSSESMRWDLSTLPFSCGVRRFDLDVVDALVEQVPLEGCAEFCAVVGLHAVDL